MLSDAEKVIGNKSFHHLLSPVLPKVYSTTASHFSVYVGIYILPDHIAIQKCSWRSKLCIIFMDLLARVGFLQSRLVHGFTLQRSQIAGRQLMLTEQQNQLCIVCPLTCTESIDHSDYWRYGTNSANPIHITQHREPCLSHSRPGG